MNDNCFIGIGRIVEDIRFSKNSNTGKSRATGRLIINSYEKKYDVIPFVAWDERAENIHKFCKKGQEIQIRGPLRTNSRKRSDGTYDNFFEVEIHHVSFGNQDVKEETKSVFVRKRKSIG